MPQHAPQPQQKNKLCEDNAEAMQSNRKQQNFNTGIQQQCQLLSESVSKGPSSIPKLSIKHMSCL